MTEQEPTPAPNAYSGIDMEAFEQEQIAMHAGIRKDIEARVPLIKAAARERHERGKRMHEARQAESKALEKAFKQAQPKKTRARKSA